MLVGTLYPFFHTSYIYLLCNLQRPIIHRFVVWVTVTVIQVSSRACFTITLVARIAKHSNRAMPITGWRTIKVAHFGKFVIEK